MPTRNTAILLAFTASLAGCQRSDTAANKDTAAESAPVANVVTVVAREYAFEMPDTIPAGLTRFELKDEGKEPHHLVVMKLEDGKKASDLFAAFKTMGPGGPGGPPPTWMHPVGGPNAPVAGGTANATLTLEPGEYAAFCVIPTPQGAPHIMMGMIKGFTVAPAGSGAAAAAALPASDLTITLRDYDFELSRPLTSGRHVIAVTNAGSQPHELTIVRYREGESNAKLVAWAEKPGGQVIPAYPMGGVTDIPPGKTVVIENDFPAGRYGFVCFTPDKKDGKPHFLHGMQKEFTI
ncbi:MAG TPA: hypothetical protein VNO75_02945 [Gemmatimonadaceae bacterium]|nr:hypothetical protein [Gemmatimonadaceae bacterium]